MVFALQTAVGFVDFLIVASLGTRGGGGVGVPRQFYFASFGLLAAVTTGSVALVARMGTDAARGRRVLRTALPLARASGR